MPQNPPRHVFVYGTLRRGGRNDITRLHPPPRFVGHGEVQGRLYHFDWYPGLTLGGDRPRGVVGEVYEITPQLEAVLDGIEQIEDGEHSEYFKREVPIRVHGSSEAMNCLLYEINPRRVREREPIAHCDWLEFHQALA